MVCYRSDGLNKVFSPGHVLFHLEPYVRFFGRVIEDVCIYLRKAFGLIHRPESLA